jgi:hypothetical protein
MSHKGFRTSQKEDSFVMFNALGDLVRIHVVAINDCRL